MECQIENLCKERRLETNELYSHNDFYGHAKILKSYCGYPEKYPILGVIPHGIYSRLVPEADLNFPLDYAFLTNEINLQEFENGGKKKPIVIGAPFLYLDKKLSQNPSTKTKEGTIVFPAHSTHYGTRYYDIEGFCKFLGSLPGEYKPITICLGWRDVQLLRHKDYENYGFICESAGHMFDRNFHTRLHSLITKHRYTITNDLGTHCFISNHLGNPVYIIKSTVKTVNPLEWATKCNNSDNLEIFKEYERKASDLNFSNFGYQRKLSNYILGSQHLLSENDLLKAFKLAIPK